MPDKIFLSLGSNLGERERSLQKAISAIAEFAPIIKSSSVYESKAWGMTAQPDFLNMVIEVATESEPHDFLKQLQSIEKKIGRQQRHKWGPREIDIDIIFWDQMSIDSTELIVPHPFWRERAFVLVPLAEIAPDCIPPGEHISLADLAAELLVAVQDEITKKPPDKTAKI